LNVLDGSISTSSKTQGARKCYVLREKHSELMKTEINKNRHLHDEKNKKIVQIKNPVIGI